MKQSLIILFAALFLCYSCQQEESIEGFSNNEEKTLNYLLEQGFDKSEIKPDFTTKTFVVGDMNVPFNLAQNLEKNRESSNSKGLKNRYGFNVTNYDFTRSVFYYIESNFLEQYIFPLDWATYYWTISSPNISIRRTFDRSQADIICSSYFDSSDAAFARAALPNGQGNVGTFLRINTAQPHQNFGFDANMVLMIHEIGHNLGYQHSDQSLGFQIPNTGSIEFHQNNDCGSIMKSLPFNCGWTNDNVKRWSVSDRTAIEWGYRFQ